jgi:hypothetical protein
MNTPVIKKLKLEDDGRVTVTFREKKKLDEREVTFRTHEMPRPDLVAALQELHKGVRELLELPPNRCGNGVRVTGVTWSLSENTGVRGAVLIAQADIEASDAPFNIVTPHLPCEQYSEGGQSPLMPDGIQAMLDTLEIEAMAFVDGKKRAQLSLGLVA